MSNNDNDHDMRGHNAVEIDEQEFFIHLREIESAERKKDQAVSDLRTARKRAKDAGIDLAVLDIMRKAAKFTRSETIERLNKQVVYGKFLRAAVFDQLDLFKERDLSDDEMVDEAYGKGVVAGKRGSDPSTNPWDLSTPMGQSWESGRIDGQSLLMQAIKGK